MPTIRINKAKVLQAIGQELKAEYALIDPNLSATTRAAAAALELTHETVRRYINRGILIAEKRGRDWFIPVSEIERYAATRRSAGRPTGSKAVIAHQRPSVCAPPDLEACTVCGGHGGDLEDSSKPCYECGR